MADVTVIQGDCLAVMAGMEAGSVDCIVTDPPYGVDLDYGDFDDSFEAWKELIVRFIPEAVRVSRGPVVVPTSKYEAERFIYQNFTPIWRICWFKGAACTRSPVGFKDWELAFIFGTKPRKQLHDYLYVGNHDVRQQVGGHPCPKPFGWAKWFVEKMSEPGDLVMDCFMGSGTVGVACQKAGRRFLGVEINRAYFNLASRRIAEAETPLFAGVGDA